LVEQSIRNRQVIGSSPIVGSSIYAGSLKSDLSLHCGFESSRKHIKSAGIPPFRRDQVETEHTSRCPFSSSETQLAKTRNQD